MWLTRESFVTLIVACVAYFQEKGTVLPDSVQIVYSDNLKKMIAFKPGQRIKFPPPYDDIVAYFDSITYENGEPIIYYYDENDQHKIMLGVDLEDCKHI